MRNFASNFFSEQVVPYGSDEYSIAYFKINPPGIDKIDLQLQLITHRQSKESFNGDGTMSLSPNDLQFFRPEGHVTMRNFLTPL